MSEENNPKVQDIVCLWLKEHGYNGLYNSDLECACETSDLMPCGQFEEEECRAGHYLDASNSEYDFEIGPKGGKIVREDDDL